MTRDDTASQGQMELSARIVECSYDAIFSVDEGRILTWNRGAKRLYGYTSQEAIGQSFLSLLWPSTIVEDAARLYECLTEQEGISIETDHVRKDGALIAVRMHLSPLTDGGETKFGAVVTVRRISEQEEKQELWNEMDEMRSFVGQAASQKDMIESLSLQMETLEVIDIQTGLTNRRTLCMTLDNECRRAARYCMPLSFLMLSVDHLTQYREMHGELSSGAILSQIAILLQEEARTTDLVACYEAELLCMVLPHTDRAGALVAAERIRERVAAFYGQEQAITVSVGAATFSHTMESGKDLMAEAEKALLIAKQEGCDRVVHFEATSDYVLFQSGRARPRPDSVVSSDLSGAAVVRGQNGSILNTSRKELAQAYETTVEGWAKMLDMRDNERGGHSQRVMKMTVRLAQLMGINGQELVYVRWGAMLHDIGKLGIPDSILFKPGPLTPEEWAVMCTHPIRGYETLESIPFLQPALVIPLSHHEKWDGSGYPQGLQGEEIPLAARIFAIVDVWDALCSDRPYRKAWTERDALDYIYSQSGKHFEPRVEQAFHQMMLANHSENESETALLEA